MSKPKQRHKSRELLLQLIFQWDYTKNSTQVSDLLRGIPSSTYDKEYFDQIHLDIFKKIELVDDVIKQNSIHGLKRLNKVELAVLRLASYELLFRDDIPFKVCIDQAAILNKKFGTTEGYKYINGVLDAIAQDKRKLEYLATKKKED